MVLNSCFETMKKNYFFTSSEIFCGKSVSDICLNDPVAVLDALK